MKDFRRAETLWHIFTEDKDQLLDSELGFLMDFAQPIATQVLGELSKRGGDNQTPEGGED